MPRIAAFALLLALCLSPWSVRAESPYVDIEKRLTAEQLRATGIDTLSAEQLALLNRQTQHRRQEFEAKSHNPQKDSWHRCVICNRTERDDADLEFRVADDDREYCMEHLGQAPAAKR